jgi:MarR family 2-MHQ and catechol resistance regulon transcriptional repressor
MKNIKNDTQLDLKLVIALSRTQTEFSRGLQVFLSAYGLTIAQFGVLEALLHKGPMKICELIEKTLSTSGNMTVVIRNLEKDALIIRTHAIDDKRAFQVRLTEKGKTLIECVFTAHLEYISSFFTTVTTEEKEQLLSLLKRRNHKID